MFDLSDVIRILDAESEYYNGNARRYRNSLTGLITLGLGSLISLLALLRADQITLPNDLEALIPSYTAILLISYGLFLLFQWYNVKLLTELMEAIDAAPKDRELLTASKITGDPFRVTFNLSFLIAIVATLFTLSNLSSSSPSSWWLLLIIWIVLLLPIAWRIYRSKRVGGSIAWVSLKLTSNPLIFYPYSLGLLVTGLFFLIFIPMAGGTDGFIISLYIVVLQIIFVQGLAFYKAQIENKIIAFRLVELRYKLIHGEVKNEDFLSLHEKIIKKPMPKVSNIASEPSSNDANKCG